MTVTKTATNPETARRPSLFYDSARAGMADFLAVRKRAEPDLRVLLPSFIGWSPHEGSGVFDPVAELDLPPEFYGLRDDLTVDLADLESRLADGGPAVVVLIHYFGRTEPQLAQVAEVVHGHGSVLVEDLAHGFFTARGDGPAGRAGDLSMYSLHKMFPTPSATGGMVTYRRTDLLTEQRGTRPDLAAFLFDLDWREIADRRRANADVLRTALLTLRRDRGGFDLPWPELPAHDVPQTFPVRISDDARTGLRDTIYARMNAEGFGMVSLYHTLIPHLRDREDMAEVARTIINFPVHQDMAPDDVAPMVASFARALTAGAESS